MMLPDDRLMKDVRLDEMPEIKGPIKYSADRFAAIEQALIREARRYYLEHCDPQGNA